MIGSAVGVAVGAAMVISVAAASPIIGFIGLMKSRIRKMTKEPKLPHGLKWGDRTAARVDEVEYLIGIRIVGYTCLKDVITVEVHESVADEAGAWRLPENLRSPSGCEVFVEKPRAGAYYKYINLRNIVHEES